MALVECQECGNDVSDRARECPHCGLPRSSMPTVVTVSNVEIQFDTMVIMFIKAALAAVPALFILSLITLGVAFVIGVISALS